MQKQGNDLPNGPFAPAGGRAIVHRMDKDVPRAHHDMGGVSKFLCEPVDVEPHALTDFDKEVDALRAVLGMKRVMTVDELRRWHRGDPGGRIPSAELLPPLDPLDHRQPAGQGRDHRGGACAPRWTGCDARVRPWRGGAGEGRLAGDARPGAYPHAALSARHAGTVVRPASAHIPTRRTSPSPDRPPRRRCTTWRSTSPRCGRKATPGDELLVEIYEHWLEPA